MGQPGSILQVAIGTVVANAVAVAVAFGAPLTHPQQDVLLLFFGSVSTLVFTVYAAVHVHRVSAAVKLASSAATAPAAPSPDPGGGGG